jgi:hypothetical protein
MTPNPRIAEVVLKLLLDGMLEDLAWTCEVYDARNEAGKIVLRSEFSAYSPHGGMVLQLRSLCDRGSAFDHGFGGVAFRFEVEPLSSGTSARVALHGSDAIRLFGILRHRHTRVLEMEAREPFRQEPAGFESRFENILDLVEGHSPSLWRWNQIAHEGGVRELERRYETRIDRLQFTLQEFTNVETGTTRFAAVVEWADSDESPLLCFGPLEAGVLVGAVKERALAAKKSREV